MMLHHPQDFRPHPSTDEDEGYAFYLARLFARAVAGGVVIGLLCVTLYGMLAL